MTTWVEIPDSLVDVRSPGTITLFANLRDNPIAIAEQASGAPKMSVNCDRAQIGEGSSSDFDGMGDYAGCRIFYEFDGTNNVDSTVSIKVSYSTDGASFFGDTTLHTVSSNGVYNESGMAFVDFASGDIVASRASGTMSGASLSITHIRVEHSETGSGTSRNLYVYLERTGGAV